MHCSLKKTVIPIPSFYGYEYVAKACESEIFYYKVQHSISDEKIFGIGEELFQCLDESVDVLFLANPNNPVAVTVSKLFMDRLLVHCLKKVFMWFWMNVLLIFVDKRRRYCQGMWNFRM